MTDLIPWDEVPTVGFTGSHLDRADAMRKDPIAMAAAAARRDARWLVFDALRPVMPEDEAGLLWLPRRLAPPDASGVFLGLDQGAPRFAVAGSGNGLGRVGDARAVAMQLAAGTSPGDAAVVAQARSLLDWHDRHRFCANCGTETRAIRAGWERKCTHCDASHFPRTDPVVIMLAIFESGDEPLALVGRQSRFPPRTFSALAGFVEPGESLEEAVARELFEEAGIGTRRVRYLASQPWPFPSNLMLAAFAEAAGTDLRLDHDEIEEARWVSKADVRAALDGVGDWVAPPPLAIAHTLLRNWAGRPIRPPATTAAI